MIRSISKFKNLMILFGLFLFAEYLRVISEFLIDRSADNLVFCVIAMVWVVYLKRRIVDEGIQKVLIGLSMSMMFLFVVRTCKYVLFDKNTILWYMYYIPLTMMPLLVYFMSKRIGRQQTLSAHKFNLSLIVVVVLINGMILTNDYHQLVFRFTRPDDIDSYTYGIGYFITIAEIIIFIVLSLCNLYRVCRLPQSRSKIWIPIVPILLGAIAIILDVFHMVPIVNDTQIYHFQDAVLIMVISIVEACIYIGIIPSNDGYEEIFSNSKINACIVDDSNQLVYSSDDNHIISEAMCLEAGQIEMLDDYTRLHANAINGGLLYYTEDIQEIVKLNHMLEEAAEVISAENEMIEAHNQMLADEAMYKMKNKVYDDIARMVRPQVLLMEECIANCEQESDAFDLHMAKAMVLNAYIKRRINLSLIAIEQSQISLSELGLAIAESLTYLSYSKIATSVLNNMKNQTADAKDCIKAYDVFEKLLEIYYGKMTAVMVTINERKNQMILRMTIETPFGDSLLPTDFNEYEIYEDEETLDVTISLLEGGA